MKFAKHLIIIVLSCILFACKEQPQKVSKENAVLFTAFTGKLGSGSIKRIENLNSKYVKPRNIDIWLPDGYSEKEKYDVLYMHDGQMLFDPETTWNKQEWKVDEIIGRLIEENKIRDCIVVAIWNISDIRYTDYYPNKPFESLSEKVKDSINIGLKKYMGNKYEGIQSDNYLKFIVEEVKPIIDRRFSVNTKYKNTFISGSSMGGLISMYALCEYPNIFGGAACLSTHWPGLKPTEKNPVPESFFSYLEQNLPPPDTHKIYFDFGTKTLDKHYISFEDRVNKVLKLKGYDESNGVNLKFVGHDHSENSWNKRFHIPVTFLLKK